MNILISFCLFFLISCSHTPKTNSFAITASSSGLMKNHIIPFAVYLTDSLEDRTSLEKKYEKKLFIIHTGHILDPKLTKTENVAQLENLVNKGFDLVNLALEDIIIADVQDIKFDQYNQTFLNSSVIDLSQDSLVSAKNIVPKYIHDSIAFIGLSDDALEKKLPKEKFIISDYVLAILKVKKEVMKNTNNPIKSFVIIHSLGSDINDIMSRLPPSFINSLAD